MLTVKFPSDNFVEDCNKAVRNGEAFEIVVLAGSGKVNSVRRSIAEMRGGKGRLYQLTSIFWDKWKTTDLWIGLARATALDWQMECAGTRDLTVRLSPPGTDIRRRDIVLISGTESALSEPTAFMPEPMGC